MIERLTKIQEGLAPTTIQELELKEMEHEKVMEIQTQLTENGKGSTSTLHQVPGRPHGRRRVQGILESMCFVM